MGLLLLERRHWAAIEVDLVPLGLTLADIPDRFSHRALLNWLQYQGPGTAIYRSVNGDEPPPFTAVENRLSDVADLLQLLIYVQRRAHFKGNPDKPKMLPRPRTADQLPTGETRLGSASMTFAEMDAWLAEIDRRDRAGKRTLTLRTEVV